MSTKKILLIDGSNLAFRMYYALEYSGLTSPGGEPSWAIFGFFKALFDVINRQKPQATVAFFDPKGPTFRHESFSYYKANRPTEMPDSLASQWPEIIHGLEIIGIPALQMSGYEADDLIGTVSVLASDQRWDSCILSGDKDLLQLVNEKVQVIIPSPRKGQQILDRDGVKSYLGIYPEQVVDFKALCGDSSDNIPGVRGIGNKTAIKLLEEYDSLENVYQNLANLKSKSLQKKLFEGEESAKDSQFLAKIRLDCPLPMAFAQLTAALQPNLSALSDFLSKYKLTTLHRQLKEIFPDLQELDAQTSLFDSAKKIDLSIQRKSILSPEDLSLSLQKAGNSDYFALDLETTGLDTMTCEIIGCALAWKKQDTIQSIYIPSSDVGTDDLIAIVRDFFARYRGKTFIQNLKFEDKILTRYDLSLPGDSLDTMLASYIENPEQSHGLKAQALRVFSYQMTEIAALIGPKGKAQKNMSEVPLEQITQYACDDAALTLALGEHYCQTLPPSLNKLWQELESPLAFVLAKMEREGISINTDILEQLSKDLEVEIVRLESQIKQSLDLPEINLNSNQQLAQALVDAGYPLKKFTSTGQLSTDIKVLLKLQETDKTGGLIEQIIEYRTLSKLRSTYAESLIKAASDSKIHTEFNQSLTSTGRLSSSNPNLQNIPTKNEKFSRVIRSSFQAHPKHLLICADYSQIELRILAHYSQDPVLSEAFQQNQDIHTRTAAEVFEVSLEEVNPAMRRTGKTLNFALIYQQGIQATAKQLAISQAQSSEFMEKYFQSFPRIRPFQDECLEKARQQGYTETIWGRRRYFRNLNSHNYTLRRAEERAAFNAPLQGSAADLIKFAMLRIKQNPKLSPAKILLQVHDELLIQVPTLEASALSEIIQEEMLFGQPLDIPLAIEIGVAENWAKSKTLRFAMS